MKKSGKRPSVQKKAGRTGSPSAVQKGQSGREGEILDSRLRGNDGRGSGNDNGEAGDAGRGGRSGEPVSGKHERQGVGLRECLIPLLIIAVCLAVYWQVRGHDFLYFDDRTYVTENRHVLSGLSGEGMRWAFDMSAKDQAYWHPLTWLSHMVDVELWGLDAGRHHLTNVGFHLLNVLLLFIVLRLMTGEVWKSSFVAALFALHPVNVDTVAWIAERKNLLSTFFWLVVMAGYVFYAKKPGVLRYALVFVLFVLGLLSKPMLVSLPFVLLLLDYWPLGRISFGQEVSGHAGIEGRKVEGLRGFLLSPAVLDKIPLIVVSLVSISVSMLSLQAEGAVISTQMVPIGLRIENALVSYIGYLREAVWPYGLAVYYPFPNAVPLWKAGLSLLALGLITAGAALSWRKRPHLLVGWLWFVGVLFPVSGLIQGGLWPAMADRWAYVPFVGLFLGIAWGVPELVKTLPFKREFLAASSAAVLFVLALSTSRQIGYWKDDVSLFSHALDVTENNYLSQHNLGAGLIKKGDIEGAIRHYSESLRMYPDNAEANYDMGVAFGKKGDMDRAMRHFLRAVEIDPSLGDAYTNMGALYIRMGRPADAMSSLSKAIRINPYSVEAYYNLGMVYESLGRPDEAFRRYMKVVELDPGYSRAYQRLGWISEAAGRYDEAARCYARALSIDPASPEIHVNLAGILLRGGKVDDAIGHYEKALLLSPGIAAAHNGLGAALMSKGKAEEAILHFQEAVRLDPGYAGARMNLKRAEAMKVGY